MTPVLPLSKPPNALPKSAAPKLLENPTIRRDSVVPKQPISITGLRPILSEIVPQIIPEIASVKLNAEMSMPA